MLTSNHSFILTCLLHCYVAYQINYHSLKDYLEQQESLRDKIVLTGKKDMYYTGNFEVVAIVNTATGRENHLIHSRKQGNGSWAKTKAERKAICEQILALLSKHQSGQ